MTINSIEPVPSWHPLYPVDLVLLSAGWTNDGQGWLVPDQWKDAMRVNYAGSVDGHWRREHAIQFTVRYYERII